MASHFTRSRMPISPPITIHTSYSKKFPSSICIWFGEAGLNQALASLVKCKDIYDFWTCSILISIRERDGGIVIWNKWNSCVYVLCCSKENSIIHCSLLGNTLGWVILPKVLNWNRPPPNPIHMNPLTSPSEKKIQFFEHLRSPLLLRSLYSILYKDTTEQKYLSQKIIEGVKQSILI